MQEQFFKKYETAHKEFNVVYNKRLKKKKKKKLAARNFRDLDYTKKKSTSIYR